MKDLYKDIQKKGERYQFDKIILFGSRARGDATEKSDVDIAVYAKDRSMVSRFVSDLEELDTLLRFDVVFIDDTINKEFLDTIKKDGVIIMDRFQTKRDNYINAVERLQEAIEEYAHHSSKTVRDGVIQRFEFTTELAWKTLREYLIDQGFARKDTPKSVMKDAYAHDFIHDESIWVDMLNDRNQTSHIYQDEIAQQIFERIINKYANELKELATFMKKV